MRKALGLLCSAALAVATDKPPVSGPLELSLKRAVDIAVAPEGSTKLQLAIESRKQAESRSAQARAALLPDLSAAFTQQNLTRNLGALGIKVPVPIPGFRFPTFVGPFNNMDARVSGSQSVFDFASIRRFQASKVGVSAAKADVSGTEEQVAAQVARAYLTAVKADADVEAAKATVALSEAVQKQAEPPKTPGTGTPLPNNRPRRPLSNNTPPLLAYDKTLPAPW